jgi:hypothetical protein
MTNIVAVSGGGNAEAVLAVGGGTDKDVVDGVWLLDLVAGKWWQVSKET